jgi:hypothetical protein
MVLKACQQNTLCHSGSERLVPSAVPEKQASQPNESSPGPSDHLHSAKKVNKYIHNLTTYARIFIAFVTIQKDKVKLSLCFIN